MTKYTFCRKDMVTIIGLIKLQTLYSAKPMPWAKRFECRKFLIYQRLLCMLYRQDDYL
jgi:hypothetical protein